MMLRYTNPVWDGGCADPFVLKSGGHYYAYGTSADPCARQADGRVFPVLRSTDLAHWEWVGGALQALTSDDTVAYWAPEVAERDGRFYLYYSAAGPGAGDETHRLRVAVADRPEGPFADSGQVLLPGEGFTIDAHPFRDPADGRWYLFFAKDFFDARVGTALAVVPLAEDMASAAGPVTTALRPSSDWQISGRNRALYGQTWEQWHTVEGASILFHDGRYYCLYSGAAFTTADYGVGFAVADSVLGPYTEADDGVSPGPRVLRGVPDHVIGPGHNSVILGPDDRTPFIVYHAWDLAHTKRQMRIDPLLWTPDGPRCAGPTWTPQTLILPLNSP